MQISISGRDVEVAESQRVYITEKLVRLEGDFGKIPSATVILKVDKPRHQVEATLQLHGAEVVVAQAEDEDVHVAIDTLADKLGSQLKKYKEKQALRGADAR
ncbi:Ribosome hibernation promoting factor [Streptomyces avidinii]